MKKLIFLLLVTYMFSNITPAQTKDETAVATNVEAFRKAMVDADSIALDRLLMNSLSYGHSLGMVQTKQELIHSLNSGESDFVTIDLSNQTIQVLDNTAIVRHTLEAKTNDNGKPGTVKLLVLTVWHKDHGDWKIWARQAVRPPAL